MKYFIIADNIEEYERFCIENEFDSSKVFYCFDEMEARRDVGVNMSKGILASIIDIRK